MTSARSDLFGGATAKLELPLGGDYLVGAVFDRSPSYYTDGWDYANNIARRLDASADLAVFGERLDIRPLKEVFRPGEKVMMAAT